MSTPKALRELADLIERFPELTPNIDIGAYVGALGSAEFTDLVRKLGGRREKSMSGGVPQVTRDFGGVTLTVVGSAASCVKRVVGVETVEVPDYSSVPTKTVEREIIEWDCPPLLLKDDHPVP